LRLQKAGTETGDNFLRNARGGNKRAHSVFVYGQPGDIEERLRPLIDGVEDFIRQTVSGERPGAHHKKKFWNGFIWKNCRSGFASGVIQGRLEEMSMTDLLQSLEMGPESCRLVVRHDGEQGELFFASGQCRRCANWQYEGDDAVLQSILWTAGEFEIGLQRGQRFFAHYHDARHDRVTDGSDALDG